jgi:hypothetical protein
MKVNIETSYMDISTTNLNVRYELKENVRGDAVLFQGKQKVLNIEKLSELRNIGRENLEEI